MKPPKSRSGIPDLEFHQTCSVEFLSGFTASTTTGRLVKAPRTGPVDAAAAAAGTDGRETERPEAESPEDDARGPVAPAPVAASVAAVESPEAATGVLALAQRLHDEHVRSGQEQRDRLVAQAQEHAQQLVGEAEQRKAETLGSLEQERSLLERKIEELRTFEREYRTRLRSYLESHLRDLDSRGSAEPAQNARQNQHAPA